MITREEYGQILDRVLQLPPKEKKQALRILCKRSLFFLSEFVLRNADSEKVPLDDEFHGSMCNWLETLGNRKMLMAPRGHLKSSIANRNYCIWRIINDPSITILIVSATLDNAKKKLRSVQEMFERNNLFRWIFDDVIPDKFTEDWTQTQMLVPRKSADAEMTIEVQGYESELTSRHYKLLLFDDIVGKENSSNREQVQKVINFYTQSLQLLKKPDGELLIIGTLWHYDDLHNHVMENLYSEFDIYARSVWREDRLLRGRDKKYIWVSDGEKKVPLYPELFNLKEIEALKKEIVADPLQGISTWMAQYELKIVDEATAIFPRKYVSNENFYFVIDDLVDKKLAFSLAVDPAVSETKQADETVFTLRAVDDSGIWYPLGIYGERGMKENDIVDKIIWYLQNYPIDLLTVEGISFQRNIQYALENKCRELGIFLPFYKLPSFFNSASKNDSDMKIRGLAPLYVTGKIRFLKNDYETNLLLDQLWRFPKSSHDDRCLDGDTLIATKFGDKKIKDIIVGDNIITPIGLKKVLVSGCTGYKKVINNIGITGTPDHPIFNNGFFDNLDTICNNNHISGLTAGNLIIWKYKKLLHSMEKNTALWEGKKDIILVHQQQIREGKILKDFMWRFGSFIIKKKFQKAILFTIMMVIHLITILLIWNCYHIVNTAKNIGKIILRKLKIKFYKIIGKQLRRQKYGINQLREENGTLNIIKKVWRSLKKINLIVSNVIKKFLVQDCRELCFVQVGVNKDINIKPEDYVKKNNVSSVVKNISDLNGETPDSVQEDAQQFLSGEIRKVYNIEVEDAHCFYANGILVGNCDSLSMHLHLPIVASKVWKQSEKVITIPIDETRDRYGHKIPSEKFKKYI